jgi:hypothetical protein
MAAFATWGYICINIFPGSVVFNVSSKQLFARESANDLSIIEAFTAAVAAAGIFRALQTCTNALLGLNVDMVPM